MGMMASGTIRRRRARATPALLIGTWVATLAATLADTAAAAHTRNDSLGAPAASTDHLEITCFDDGGGAPQSIQVEILDASPGALPQVSVQLQRGDSLVSASDTTNTDGSPSPEIGLNGPVGIFRVLVTKSGAGLKYYSLSYHCTAGPDGTGNHTGTSISVLQNQ